MLFAEKWRVTYWLSKEDKEIWIEDYVDRETAVARKQVQDAERAILQEQEDMWNADMAGSTTRKPEETVKEMLNTIGDSLSDLTCSDDEENREDKEDDEEDARHGKLSEDDEPGWVMGTITQTIHHLIGSFRLKQMRLDELMQPESGDTADCFSERDMMYGTAELLVLAVVNP